MLCRVETENGDRTVDVLRVCLRVCLSRAGSLSISSKLLTRFSVYCPIDQ
jgi:hypothetical protein